MKILARKLGDAVVLDAGRDPDVDGPAGRLGQILQINPPRLFPPFCLQSILARGYWSDPDLTDEERNLVDLAYETAQT